MWRPTEYAILKYIDEYVYFNVIVERLSIGGIPSGDQDGKILMNKQYLDDEWKTDS